MRLTINNEQFEDIISSLEHRPDLIDLLQDKKKEFERSITAAKKEATKIANKSKIDNTKEKIENAINLMRLENKKISVAQVAKTANIHYDTAKKYKDFIDSQK